MEPVILAVVIGSLAAIKTALRCMEILARAYAYNLCERSRRETAVSILAGLKVSGDLIVSGKCETIASEPKH